MSGVWPFKPTDEGEEGRDYSVERVQFGGGYRQRIPDGVNTTIKKWELTFNLHGHEVGEARQFLDGRGGYRTFTLLDPSSGSPRQVTCSRWKMSPVRGTNRFLLRASFEEEFSS